MGGGEEGTPLEKLGEQEERAGTYWPLVAIYLLLAELPLKI